MKIKREEIQSDADSSFKILLTPKLNDIFYWHFHPEYELVFAESPTGVRHIGDHISKFEGSDLALIGPNIPHLNFDYGVKTQVEIIVVQMKEHFLGQQFFNLPEMQAIQDLMERAKKGLAFYGNTKRIAGEKLKQLSSLSHFEQLMSLLEIFQMLARSTETIPLNVRPLSQVSLLKEQRRLQQVYHLVETRYEEHISVHEAAALANLSPSAFCRYFKKTTHLTFTDFVNRYRVNQAKKLLMQQLSVSEACYRSGFENLSHFN
ncbi:MAG: helix-turn-helix domain-containing protein, partial [Bacteroidota bacterium]|nr:helix-turn-helix domain-containing protein [Bacteroidota bacterium]